MNLDELNRKLHGRDLHLNRDRKPDLFEPSVTTPDEEKLTDEFKQTETWKGPEPVPAPPKNITFEDVSGKKRRKKIALILGSIALVLLIGGVIFKVYFMMFREEKITVNLTGPEDVASAEFTTFNVEYANNNYSQLQNVTLIFTYPETFQPEKDPSLKMSASRAEMNIGTIPGMSSGKKSITGKFYGSKGDTVELQATLQYSQKNVTSIMTKQTKFAIDIVTSPLLIEIEAPAELATGQDVDYVVNYRNAGDQKFSNLRVRLEYTNGFVFLNAEPRPSFQNNEWYIGDLDAGKEGKILIHGTLSGARDERKAVIGKIGLLQGDGNFLSYGENERKTRIVTSPLSLRQTVNDKADATASLSEVLRYDIEYKNDGNIGVRDAIVILEIDSPYLNYGRLQMTTKGAYDPAKKMIIWKASDVPALAQIEPGETGKVSFIVPVVDAIPEKATDRNIAIRTLAKIDSPDVPAILSSNKIIGSNVLYVKLNTAVDTALDVFYADTTFPNTGPLPPKVGSETSYTLHLSARNTSSDVTSARTVVSFPSGIRYTGKFSPENEKIIFNERTNELSWDMGTFEPGKERKIIFQIAGTPNQSHVDQELPLVNAVVFTGKDSFTQKDMTLEKKGETSNIPEDSSGGRVQKAE